MITDLRSLEDALQLDCDVCIVGAGAAGLSLAVELAGSPLDVVVLEAGGETLEKAAQELYDARIDGRAFKGHLEGRFRVFGGTTTQWGGQALELSRWDLEQRAWIPGSGWPLPYDELARYYARASEYLGIDLLDYGEALAARLGARLPEFDPSELHPYFAKWSPQPNFAERYGPVVRRASNIRVLLHANLTTIELGASGTVSRLHARTLEGKRLTVMPRHVVLATGGLETARILLANRSQRPSGIGNEHDLVGRFFQDHPGGRFGVVRSDNQSALQRAFNVYHRRGVRYSVRFALPTDVQRRERVASASATLMFQPPADSSFELMKRVYRRARTGSFDAQLLADIGGCAADLPNTLRPLASFIRGRVFTPGAEAVLYASCEQEPNADSRVTLAADVDALGMPRLDIQWRLSELTGRTLRLLAHSVKRGIERLGLGDAQLDDWVDGDEWEAHLDDHFHHMGTTRMSATPASGVVDRDCAVHGIANLYIASSSVFPTGGFSNPTLTILALAVRLADRIKAVAA